MFANIGLGEIIVIALVLMLFFGGDKLPELAPGIRRATHEFSRPLNENDSPPTKSKKNKS